MVAVKVTLNGKDITNVPTDFSLYEDGQLEVGFTKTPARIAGTVTDADGEPVSAPWIIVNAAEPALCCSTGRPRLRLHRVTHREGSRWRGHPATMSFVLFLKTPSVPWPTRGDSYTGSPLEECPWKWRSGKSHV